MLNYSNEQLTEWYEFKSHTWPLIFLLFICFWSFFYNSGVIEVDYMEARNLVTAREILENNNWLVPTMNGEIRIAKPPLPTWFAALASLSVGGTDNLSLLRIPNALASLLLIFFAYGLCWTLSRDRNLAFMSAAILATNFLMMRVGHRASWDIFCHTFMLGALWAFAAGLRENRGWPVFAAMGTLMGLSFMSKGPVSFYVLLLPFIVSYFWIFGIHELKTKWPLLALAILICAFISSLWPLYISSFHPEAFLATVQQESQAWGNKHVRSFSYYLNFPLYSGLWLVVTIAVLIKPFAEKRIKAVQNYRFLLLWLVLVILLLSIVPEKKLRYLMPAMIPLALLGGTLIRGVMIGFRQGKPGKGNLRVIAFHAFLVSIVGVIYPCALFYQLYATGQAATPLFTILVLSIFLAIVVNSWIFFKRRNVFGLFYLTAIQFCVIAFLYMDLYRDVSFSNKEYKIMTQNDSAALPPETSIFLLEDRLGIQYVWDLRRQIKQWNIEEVRQLLASGETIAVISGGDPYEAMAETIDGNVDIQVIGRFDYNKDKTQKIKTVLSRIRLKN